jgi:hypothetical protein
MRTRIATPKPGRARVRRGDRPGGCADTRPTGESNGREPAPERSTFRRVAVFVPFEAPTL